MRYFGSGVIVIADQSIYQTLGVNWTMTMLGIIAAVLMPVSWVFWWKGEVIRRRSEFMAPLSLNLEEEIDRVPDD
jgi:DHA1 family multidrug resistance protein-like MFS transporter